MAQVVEVHGLYRTDPQAIEILASSKGSASTMIMVFGRGRWHARRLTPDELASPEVQAEIASLRAEGVWPET